MYEKLIFKIFLTKTLNTFEVPHSIFLNKSACTFLKDIKQKPPSKVGLITISFFLKNLRWKESLFVKLMGNHNQLKLGYNPL